MTSATTPPSSLHRVDPNPATWDAFVQGHPQAHFLQTHAWGQLKGRFGWQPYRVALAGAEGALQSGATLLVRQVAGITLAYIPKGPLVDWHDPVQVTSLLTVLRQEARSHGAAFLKIEPDLADTPANQNLLTRYGFRPSPHTIQPRSTLVLDLSGTEEEILARMKSKWRYNIRLAQRKGVTVRALQAPDLPIFHELMQTTAQRNDFAVHSSAYYAAAFELFDREQAAFLLAEFEGEPLAAVVVMAVGAQAWYPWGASGNRHRNLMPNHALHWAAICWARQRGARRYDLWGIPDEIGQLASQLSESGASGTGVDDLPIDLTALPEGELWGVYRLKQGFGGSVVRFVGAWDLPYNPVLYAGYRAGLQVQAVQQAAGGWRQTPGWLWSQLGQAAPLANRRSSKVPPKSWRPVTQPAEWRQLLAALPDPHALQSWEWGKVKEQTGWHAERRVWEAEGVVRAAYQLLWRQPIPYLPLRMAYVPKGPVLDWSDDQTVGPVLDAIIAHARQVGALVVKIDPNVERDQAAGRSLLAQLTATDWQYSREQIQFPNTGRTDLSLGEEDLLEQMKSKWRYNLRLAERRGVTVRVGDLADFPAFYRLYAETGRRDGFLIRPAAYYEEVVQTFLQAQSQSENPAGGALLLAEHGEEEGPLAALFLLRYGATCWYLYGASSELRRRDMPNHLLQWAALSWAKAQGCTSYDWWGAPTNPQDPEDPMQGVWRFKEGFGAQMQIHVGAWDRPLQPIRHHLYQDLWPALQKRLKNQAPG